MKLVKTIDPHFTQIAMGSTAPVKDTQDFDTFRLIRRPTRAGARGIAGSRNAEIPLA
ncbi:hypothetical protein [Streptosporangium sp. NPDC049644]|uniref:hypothetical protein n=1 Tax=Streptosporangium sp. NPDC049644 TaxID=3155507 RepID=UPI00343CD241